MPGPALDDNQRAGTAHFTHKPRAHAAPAMKLTAYSGSLRWRNSDVHTKPIPCGLLREFPQLNLDTEFLQHTRSHAITFKEQPKENILSADTVVIEYLGLFGGLA